MPASACSSLADMYAWLYTHAETNFCVPVSGFGCLPVCLFIVSLYMHGQTHTHTKWPAACLSTCLMQAEALIRT